MIHQRPNVDIARWTGQPLYCTPEEVCLMYELRNVGKTIFLHGYVVYVLDF